MQYLPLKYQTAQKSDYPLPIPLTSLSYADLHIYFYATSENSLLYATSLAKKYIPKSPESIPSKSHIFSASSTYIGLELFSFWHAVA